MLYQLNNHTTSHIIDMGQCYSYDIDYEIKEDNTIYRYNLQIHTQLPSCCYGHITSTFRSNPTSKILLLRVETFAKSISIGSDNTVQNILPTDMDAAMSYYDYNRIERLLRNIIKILRVDYNIRSIDNAYTYRCDESFKATVGNTRALCDTCIHVLFHNAAAYEAMFTLNMIRRLCTLSNKLTNDIIFYLTEDATKTWEGFNAVDLMVILDYFNCTSALDSRIGLIYLSNPRMVRFLNGESFKTIVKPVYAYTNTLATAIINNSDDVQPINSYFTVGNLSRLITEYKIPSPDYYWQKYLYQNDRTTIDVVKYLKPFDPQTADLKAVETYIGFLKANITSNLKSIAR